MPTRSVIENKKTVLREGIVNVTCTSMHVEHASSGSTISSMGQLGYCAKNAKYNMIVVPGLINHNLVGLIQHTTSYAATWGAPFPRPLHLAPYNTHIITVKPGHGETKSQLLMPIGRIVAAAASFAAAAAASFAALSALSLFLICCFCSSSIFFSVLWVEVFFVWHPSVGRP